MSERGVAAVTVDQILASLSDPKKHPRLAEAWADMDWPERDETRAAWLNIIEQGYNAVVEAL